VGQDRVAQLLRVIEADAALAERITNEDAGLDDPELIDHARAGALLAAREIEGAEDGDAVRTARRVKYIP
jgi:hypothetical protein